MPLIARDKKGRAARRATRNAQGKFTKTTKTTIDFFAFPPEIRAIIYTFHFAYERSNRTPRTIQEPKSSLKSKLALLRASKAIRAEAKALFYRNHIFHIPILPETITSGLAIPNRLITSVQLIDPSHKTVTSGLYALERDYTHFETFLQHLPNLRFLRLGIEPYQRHTFNMDPPVHPFRRWDSPIFRILAKLRQRLNRLELYILVPKHARRWPSRVAIAPDLEWILEDSGNGGKAAKYRYWARHRSFWALEHTQRSVWALEHTQRLPDVAGLTKE